MKELKSRKEERPVRALAPTAHPEIYRDAIRSGLAFAAHWMLSPLI